MPTAPSTKQADKRPPLTMRQKALLARQHARTAHTVTRGVMPSVAPVAAMGLLVAASAALNAATQATDADSAILGSTAATCVVVAVVAAHQFKQRLDDKKSLQRARLFLVASSAWLVETTAFGLNLNAVAILGLIGSVLSLHWWRQRRIPNVAVPIAAGGSVPKTAEPEADVYTALWAERLGRDGSLAGSRLIDPKGIRSGVRYTLSLLPGKQTIDTATGMHEKIKGALDLLPDQDVIIEQHPSRPASFLHLTVVTRSPIKESALWPGPAAFNPETGRIDLGPYADGEGTASWRLYTEDSIWGGFIAGDPGSGKSRTFESLALAAAAAETHPTVVWFADGDEGASSPMLKEFADHIAVDAELDQAYAMFAGALLIMQVRRAENTVNGWSGFTPTADRPGLLIFIDECHVVFADKRLRVMAAEIARRGRKVGVAIVAGSQVVTLDAFGGAGNEGADALRLSLRAGNSVCLKSSTANTKEVFGVEFNPAKFPDLPGYGYRISGKGDTARTAPFRGYFVDKPALKTWPGKISWRSLPGGEANVYGPEYVTRRDLAEEFQADKALWIAEMKAGRRRPSAQQIQRLAPRAEGEVFQVAQIPVWDPERFAPARRIRPRDELHRSHVAVLAQLADGNDRTGRIAAAVELSERRVYSLLQELVNDFGLVRATDIQGQYELAEEPAGVA